MPQVRDPDFGEAVCEAVSNGTSERIEDYEEKSKAADAKEADFVDLVLAFQAIFAEEKAPEAEPEPAPVEPEKVVTLHAKHRPPPYLVAHYVLRFPESG